LSPAIPGTNVSSKPKPSKKVKFLVGIWVIVVALEIILPINYWVETFGWNVHTWTIPWGNAQIDNLSGWYVGWSFTILGGAMFFEWKWKFWSAYDSDKYELGEVFVVIFLPAFFSFFLGVVGYMLFEWVGAVLGVAGVCIFIAFVYGRDWDKLKANMAKK